MFTSAETNSAELGAGQNWVLGDKVDKPIVNTIVDLSHGIVDIF